MKRGKVCKGARRNFLEEVIEMFIILNVVMVSRLYTCHKLSVNVYSLSYFN